MNVYIRQNSIKIYILGEIHIEMLVGFHEDFKKVQKLMWTKVLHAH